MASVFVGLFAAKVHPTNGRARPLRLAIGFGGSANHDGLPVEPVFENSRGEDRSRPSRWQRRNHREEVRSVVGDVDSKTHFAILGSSLGARSSQFGVRVRSFRNRNFAASSSCASLRIRNHRPDLRKTATSDVARFCGTRRLRLRGGPSVPRGCACRNPLSCEGTSG